MKTIKPKSDLQLATAYLPAGQSSYGNKIICRVQIYDSLDSYASDDVSITVKGRNISLSSAYSLLKDISLSDGTDDIYSSTSIMINLLNRVDCTKAPNCIALNRNNCSFV